MSKSWIITSGLLRVVYHTVYRAEGERYQTNKAPDWQQFLTDIIGGLWTTIG